MTGQAAAEGTGADAGADTGTERREASRRAVVAAVGAAGLTAALAACGSTAEDEAGGGTSAPQGGGTAKSGTALAKTSEIPRGGGKVFKAEKVVVTQPRDGEFKAFSAVCTHSGCVVGEVSGGTINCPCHGSKFAITDGSVQDGPAPKPLPSAQVSVEGGSVTLG